MTSVVFRVVVLPYLDRDADISMIPKASTWAEFVATSRDTARIENRRFPFDHPYEQPLIDIDPVTRKLSYDLGSSTAEQEHDERLSILRVTPHRRVGCKKFLADLPDQRLMAVMRLGASVCDPVLHRLQRSNKLMRFGRSRGRIRRSGKRCPRRE